MMLSLPLSSMCFCVCMCVRGLVYVCLCLSYFSVCVFFFDFFKTNKRWRNEEVNKRKLLME